MKLIRTRRVGLAEQDPPAGVEGRAAAATVMILSSLVFGRQLRGEQVTRRGITGITG